MAPDELREKAVKLLLADDRERVPGTREIYSLYDETIAKLRKENELKEK